ncbi:Uncharacterized protein HZ326_19771 [Fusarium oxysporum f. sp. albedinis]|nr:Uncharacterized protein HZ326_19771 [Fusarium oxysporum f. sp. albedinis]
MHMDRHGNREAEKAADVHVQIDSIFDSDRENADTDETEINPDQFGGFYVVMIGRVKSLGDSFWIRGNLEHSILFHLAFL